MITASHNPSIYNGYKVYNDQGCQVALEAAAEIKSFIDKVDYFNGHKTMDIDIEHLMDSIIPDEIVEGFLTIIPESVIDKYIEAVVERVRVSHAAI